MLRLLIPVPLLHDILKYGHISMVAFISVSNANNSKESVCVD